MVILRIGQMTFWKLGKQVASGKTALNEMVCNNGVDHILRSPLRHVTGDAIAGVRMLSRADQGGKRWFMASSALAGVILGGFLAAG